MRPMGYEELRAAVEKPAALVNLQFQSGIVDDLVKKVLGQPAALPLLQFTLRLLWDERDRNRITWEVYRKVGDPLNALKTSADQFYDGLAPQTQDEVEARAAGAGAGGRAAGSVSPAGAQEPPAAGGQGKHRGSPRAAGRATTISASRRATATADPIVEVKHESLIRNWPRLVGWIDEKRIERRQRLALTQAAHRWAQGGRPAEGLLTGWQLEEAKRQADLSDLEREFVEASAQQVDRAQREREQALQHETEQARALARSAALELASTKEALPPRPAASAG